MTKALAAVSVVLLALAGVAIGHEGGEHLMGTVKSLEHSTLIVTTKDNKDVTIHVDERTEYRKSDAPATAKDLRSGERVVVHAMKHGEMLHGTLVKFGRPAKKSSPPDAGTKEHDHHGHAH